MDTELNVYQFALARCEQQISEIDAQMAKLSSERGTLVNTRAALLRQLGRPLPADVASPDFNSFDEEDAPVSVPRNAFKNMRVSEAARKYLLMAGRPVTHPELVSALEKGKATTDGHHTREHIRTALKRRTDWFVWTANGKRGLWSLTEWPRPVITTTEPEHEEKQEQTNLAVAGGYGAPTHPAA